MQNLNIGLLQFDQAWEDKSLNYQKIRALIASDVQLDLLLLPEMFNTGFSTVSYTHLRAPRDLSTSRMPSSA